jgi:hypothetical protein
VPVSYRVGALGKESMPRHRIPIATASWLILAGAVFVATSVGRAQSGVSPFDGRWVIPSDPWFDRLAAASGQGRTGGAGRGGRGEQDTGRDLMLELRVAPTGAVSGRATGAGGRRGAPGSHPAHDVEISRGALKGDTLIFQIWSFDGFHNRLHATARVADGGLEVEFRRDTPAGAETFTTRARRATY